MWFHVRLFEAYSLPCTHCCAKDRDRRARMDVGLFCDVSEAILKLVATRRGRSVIYLSSGDRLLHPEL